MEPIITRKETHQGIEIIEYQLKNKAIEVRFLNVGGALTKIALAEDNFANNLTLAYENLGDYLNNTTFLGALVGRTSNRIKDGKITIDGTDYQLELNDGSNNLHGGTTGIHHHAFKVTKISESAYTLETSLKDGDSGFPGNLTIKVTYEIEDANLHVTYETVSDAKTIANLTQHAYFNLHGNLKADILDHELFLASDQVADVDGNSSFTEALIEVTNTCFDFRQSTVINPAHKQPHELLAKTSGYDHLFILDDPKHTGGTIAVAKSPLSNIEMTVTTNLPSVQFYAGNYLTDELVFEGGVKGMKNLGFCLETHEIPFDYEAQIHEPGKTYTSKTTFSFKK